MLESEVVDSGDEGSGLMSSGLEEEQAPGLSDGPGVGSGVDGW